MMKGMTTLEVLEYLRSVVDEGSEEYDMIVDKMVELRKLYPPVIVRSPDPDALQFNITIPGEVVGKQYKVILLGKWPKQHGSLTTTPKSKAALERYRLAVRIQAGVDRWKSLDGPVDVRIRAFIDVRPSWTRKKTQALLSGPCTAKPDSDNIEKMVLDALVGAKIVGAGFQTYEQVVITDDKLASDLHIEKRWCEIGKERLEISVTPVEWSATLLI